MLFWIKLQFIHAVGTMFNLAKGKWRKRKKVGKYFLPKKIFIFFPRYLLKKKINIFLQRKYFLGKKIFSYIPFSPFSFSKVAHDADCTFALFLSNIVYFQMVPQGGSSAPSTMQRISVPETEVFDRDEQPLYVNAKQYHRILKRRQARARLEACGKIPKERRVGQLVF